MAKLRKPSQHSIDLYNQLVEQQNKIRKQLRIAHKRAEEALGAGRLPALVIPKVAHKVKKSHFDNMSNAKLRLFWRAYREKKALFGAGLTSYIARTVMEGYKELFIDNKYGIGFKPEGAFGRYTKEQMELYPEHEKKMQAYNALFTHGSEFFLALLYSNNIPEFKWIYIEFRDGEKEDGFLDQTVENVSRFMSPRTRAQLMEHSQEIIGTYKHKDKTIKEAKRRAEED